MLGVFKKDELLFRGVRDLPLLWKNYEQKELSSAAFKDSNGVSVEQKHSRSCNQCVVDMLNYLNGSIASIRVEHCQLVECAIVYDPTDNMKSGQYHCLLYKSVEKESLTKKQARTLARNAKIEHYSKYEFEVTII